MSGLKAQNLTIYKSEKSVDKTVELLLAQIKSNESLIFFEVVNHDEIAKKRGTTLHPTRSILFEDPKLSSELIQCRQTAALDLPLEIIVWEEYDEVFIAFMDPKIMKRRFMIQECDETLEALSKLMIRITMNTLREMK